MANIKQRVALGQSKQAIVVSEITFGSHGFQESQRAGVLSIDPEKDPNEMLEAAKKLRFELVGEPNRVSGFYDVKIIGSLEDDSLVKETANSATADVSSNGDDVTQTRR